MSFVRLLHLDPLSAFGLVAVGLMLAFYALEGRSRHYTLLFAAACAMGSCYGFMQFVGSALRTESAAGALTGGLWCGSGSAGEGTGGTFPEKLSRL
jgi:hypothetical protein